MSVYVLTDPNLNIVAYKSIKNLSKLVILLAWKTTAAHMSQKGTFTDIITRTLLWLAGTDYILIFQLYPDVFFF